MLTKENFKFDHVENTSEYTDYWFKTDKTSENELMSEYMEQGMVGITEVVYCKDNGEIGIKRIFPFNFDVITPDDHELKNILKELVEEMSISTVGRIDGKDLV